MLRLEGIEIVQDDWSLSADLSLPAQSATAIIGPSGAGTSRLRDVIAGFLRPHRGRVLWVGADLTALPPAARPVTLLFQEHNLFSQMTAARNVALGLSPDLRLDAAGWARVERALASVDMAGMGNRMPAALSGGERQRVALARALLRHRPLLLLDEPFSGLGPALRMEMLDLVARIRAEQGATLLMVTHDPRDAARIAEQTVVVSDGTVSAPHPTAALLADPTATLRDYLGEG